MSKTFLFQAIQFSISMPFVLFNPSIGSYRMQPRRARVDMGAMAMEGCSAFPNALASLESHHQIVYCHIQYTHWGGFTPLQRCSWCILLPQPTGQVSFGSRPQVYILYWEIGKNFSVGSCNILTSDPAEVSNNKCTSVNNRCIRLKISGGNFDCGRVELSADATLAEVGECQTII